MKWSYWEGLLRSEGLYPEPHRKGCISLEWFEEQGIGVTQEREIGNDVDDIVGILVLTRRQKEVLKLKCEGYSTRHIALKLGISKRAVRKLLQRVREKCSAFAPYI